VGRFLVAVGLVLAINLASCGEDTVCLRRIDSRVLAPPQMYIYTSDGTDSIATATVLEGPCKATLGPRAWSDASAGSRSVTIEANLSGKTCDPTISYPCWIQIGSVDGRCLPIEVAFRCTGVTKTRHCSDNSDCCRSSEVREVSLWNWSFTESSMQLSFPDAGACAGYDAGASDLGGVDDNPSIDEGSAVP
jgi:hypothetical protein